MESQPVEFVCMNCFKHTTVEVMADGLTAFEITHLCWECFHLSYLVQEENEDEKTRIYSSSQVSF